MTDIQPPIPNERSANVHRIGVQTAHTNDSVPSVAQGQARIVYRYWIGAIAVGLMIWAAIFYIAF